MASRDIAAEFQSSTRLHAVTSARGTTVIPDVRSLLGAPVESYINGFQRPALRGAIREAFYALADDPDAALRGRCENAMRLAQDLQEMSEQLARIAAGVRQRACVASGIIQAG